jgi:hypothetical protein
MDRDITARRVMSIDITFHCCAYLPVYYYIGGKKRPRPRETTSITTWLYCQYDLFVHISLFIFSLCHFYLPSRLYRGPFGSSSLFLFFAVPPPLNRITSQYLSFLFYFLKRKGKQKKIVTSHRVPKCNLDRTHGCLVVGTGQLVYIQCRSIEFKTAGHRDSPTLVPCSTTGLELSKLLALTHVQMEIRLGVNVKGLSLCRSRLGSQCFLSCQAKSSIIRNYR